MFEGRVLEEWVLFSNAASGYSLLLSLFFQRFEFYPFPYPFPFPLLGRRIGTILATLAPQ